MSDSKNFFLFDVRHCCDCEREESSGGLSWRLQVCILFVESLPPHSRSLVPSELILRRILVAAAKTSLSC